MCSFRGGCITTVSSRIVFFFWFLPPVEGFISRFLPLYYSYSRLVREARGNRCHTLIEHDGDAAAALRCLHRREPPRLSSMDPTAAGNTAVAS